MIPNQGNYVMLKVDPPTPPSWMPSLKECLRYEYIKMSQLCRIDPKRMGRKMRACEAFGGDMGRNEVQEDRKARAVKHGKVVRKFVLSTAVITYLAEIGITDW
ncbi:MAG: hypothetical protein ACYDH2_08220 [Anaerolineaceae bacterium]